MTSTLNPTCPLCGLRYASKPLLELHIREDHRPRHGAQPDPPETGGAPASSPAARRPSRRTGLAARPSRAAKEVTAMTAARLAARTAKDRPAQGAPRPPARQRRADVRVGSHHPLGPRAAVPAADPGARGQGHPPGRRRPR